MDFHQDVYNLISRAQSALGNVSVKELAEHLGVAPTSLRNAKSIKSETFISKFLMNQLMDIAEYTGKEREAFDEAWFLYRAAHKRDSRLFSLLLNAIKGSLPSRERRKLIKEAVEITEEDDAKRHR